MPKKAFTLIELLIVIAIIGILSGVTLAVINPQNLRDRAQDATRKEDLATIAGALERYYADNGRYPRYGGSIRPLNTGGSTVSVQSKLQPSYINNIPITDPDNIPYIYGSDSSSYCLCAALEYPEQVETNNCGGFSSNYNYCIVNTF